MAGREAKAPGFFESFEPIRRPGGQWEGKTGVFRKATKAMHGLEGLGKRMTEQDASAWYYLKQNRDFAKRLIDCGVSPDAIAAAANPACQGLDNAADRKTVHDAYAREANENWQADYKARKSPRNRCQGLTKAQVDEFNRAAGERVCRYNVKAVPPYSSASVNMAVKAGGRSRTSPCRNPATKKSFTNAECADLIAQGVCLPGTKGRGCRKKPEARLVSAAAPSSYDQYGSPRGYGSPRSARPLW